MPPAPPEKIGRYRIVGRLGKGAMGVVYNAHDDVMGRQVAIKVMMADFEEDPEASTRFYREARAAGQLVHRNIITIFDMGEDNGRPYIVMELLEGRTLNDYLKRPDAADIERNLELMIQVCEGLHVAHVHGIYHRDIKPGNLVVNEDGTLKILDFGIARLSSSNLTASGLIVGTPDYMSPEQARGQDVDQRSDIFSAGAVFYFILTGRKPFAAPDLPGVLRKVEVEDPLPIRESEAPAALARIVMKALAKSPADRYQQASELIADLRRIRRDFEARGKALTEEAVRRLASIESALVERQQICDRLGVTTREDDGAIRERLANAHAPTAAALASGAQVESLGLTAATNLLAEINSVDEVLALEMASMKLAESSLQQAAVAVEAGDWRSALSHFNAAAEAMPSCLRARDEAARCRGLLVQQQAADDRFASLAQQAQQAMSLREWENVIVLCDEALVAKPDAAEVKALRERAIQMRDDESVRRKMDAKRALDRAEELRRQGKHDDAEAELARARQSDPESPQVAAFAEKLQASRLDAERASELERIAAHAITTARATFSSGQRQAALDDLRAFLVANPNAAAVAGEVDRLEAESRRLEAIEKRLADANRDAIAAEAALQNSDPAQAMKLASQALAADPSQKLAQKVAGLATAELRERAQAKARATEAARHLVDATEHLRRRKYNKARAAVQKAAQLTPAAEEVTAMVARINSQEERELADRKRARLAQQRAEAAAPVLAMARAAEAANDFVRALWTAENALALDLDCVEARQIVQRTRARLEAQPALADETVDTSQDTISLQRPTSTLWRLPGIIRKWIQLEPFAWSARRQPGSGPRARQ